MARPFALALIEQLYLEIALPGLCSQVIVAHEAVEVVRRCRAGIALKRRDLGYIQRFCSQLLHDVGGDGQCSAFRHVHDNVELWLVIHRQHFHRHVLRVEQRAASQERRPDSDTEHACLPWLIDQWTQKPAIKAIQPADETLFALFHFMQLRHRRANAHGKPRREHEGGDQRKKHRDGAEHWDRPHVRAHHAGNETHRQKRGDDREGCKNRWVADFGHRIDSRGCIDPPGHQPAPIDILHNHGRIVDQNANRENKRKQADTVDRVPEQQSGEHGY